MTFFNKNNKFVPRTRRCDFFSLSLEAIKSWPFFINASNWFRKKVVARVVSHLGNRVFGIWSSRPQGVSPPTNSPPRDHLVTNHPAMKQSLLATNNLITVNHKPKRLIRCLCHVELRVAITGQTTSYNSLVLCHKWLEQCIVHLYDTYM